MQIQVIKLLPDEWMYKAFATTVGHPVKSSRARLLRSEHSPIRALWYWIDFINIPKRAYTHLVRHKIGVEWWVETSRPDRIGGDLVIPGTRTMACMANAQALINISHKRLCSKAWHETRMVWEVVVEKMLAVDVELASLMVPTCKYRNGICPEFGSCGRNNDQD